MLVLSSIHVRKKEYLVINIDLAMLSCNKSNELYKNYFVYNIRLNNMADTLQPTFFNRIS